MVAACDSGNREVDIRCYAAAQWSLSFKPESSDYRALSDLFRSRLDKVDPKARWRIRYAEVLREFEAEPKQVPRLTDPCVHRAQKLAQQA